jgi:hypothetical protein
LVNQSHERGRGDGAKTEPIGEQNSPLYRASRQVSWVKRKRKVSPKWGPEKVNLDQGKIYVLFLEPSSTLSGCEYEVSMTCSGRNHSLFSCC